MTPRTSVDTQIIADQEREIARLRAKVELLEQHDRELDELVSERFNPPDDDSSTTYTVIGNVADFIEGAVRLHARADRGLGRLPALLDPRADRRQAGVALMTLSGQSPSEYVRALAEFHSHPNSILDDKTNGIPLRRTLLVEEFAELLEAIEEDDLEHIAREMADVLYIVFGTALVYGIDLDAAFREVHRAAMDKMRAGLRRHDGKILKPPGFRPPDMAGAVPR